MMEGIKKWPECTKTSPLGCHLGIYKTLQKHVLSKPITPVEPTTTLASTGQIQQGCNILYLIFDIKSLALEHMYPLICWHKVWTVLIEKEIGNLNLNKLCCIMIFKADWQLLLKWHSSYGFLLWTEWHGILTTAQGSGRWKERQSAIDQLKSSNFDRTHQ